MLTTAFPIPRPVRPGAAWRAVPLAAALLVLAGCSVTQPYQPPVAASAPGFAEARWPDGRLWAAGQPQSPAVGDDWWQGFDDPVLAGLQAQVAARNESLQASVALLRSAEAALGSSRASLWPTLGAPTGATRARNASTTNAAGTTTTNGSLATTYSVAGSVSWEVDLWGRVAATVSAADARLQASRDDVLAARLSLQATLAQSYFSLRAAEAQADAVQRAVAAYEKSLELTRNRYQAGVASAADVAQAQSQLKTAQVQLLELRTTRGQLLHALAVLVGQAPATFALAPTARLPQPPQPPLLVPAQLLQRRPDIAAAERRVAAANAQVGVTRAAFFPTLTLSGSAGFRGSDWQDLLNVPHRFWSLGPSLALTLFDHGARQAATDQALAAVDQAAATYRQTVLTAFQEVEDNLIAARHLGEELGLQEEALAAAQRSLDVTLNQYRAGTVSYLNVVTAQTTALTAERSLVDVRNRQLAALGQLYKNAAGRWDVPVEQLVPAARVPERAPARPAVPAEWAPLAAEAGGA